MSTGIKISNECDALNQKILVQNYCRKSRVRIIDPDDPIFKEKRIV